MLPGRQVIGYGLGGQCSDWPVRRTGLRGTRPTHGDSNATGVIRSIRSTLPQNLRLLFLSN